jgi:hypothetical protein
MRKDLGFVSLISSCEWRGSASLSSLIISQQSQVLKLVNTDLNTRKEMCMVACILYVEKGERKNICSAAATVSEVMRTIRHEG